MGYLILLVAIVVLALGMPVAFAMGVISLIYLLLSGEFSLVTIPQKIFTGMDSFLLLAIPFFVLAGALMNKGGVTRRLVDFASTLVGHIPGGLGHVTVVANVIMAGMSGTAAADAVATGSVLIPSMVRQGYSRGFAAAISACAATIGPVIPPSVSFVIFGSVASISIGQLFLAGVSPGLLMGLYLMAACYIVARRRGYGAANRRARFGEVMHAAWRAGPALLTPVFVIGGMVGYLMLGVFNILSWILAIEQIPQAITAFFLEMTDNWIIVLLVINAVLLLCGMFMEPVPIIVLLAPMLMPVIAKYGIDPVHFGLVFVLNILIGVVHPPIGTNMFITCSIARCSVGEFTREALPFIAALVLLLLFVTYVPEVTLFLPKLLAR
jgi:C4-dicarboxylate transporter DctM subunit